MHDADIKTAIPVTRVRAFLLDPFPSRRSFAIITTTPNELCAHLHNRMPVIMKAEAWPG